MARRKTGGVDLKYYEQPSTISRFENIREPLLKQLAIEQPDITFTSRDLAAFTASFQQFQEDFLGLNAPRLHGARHPTRVNAKLFKTDENLTTDSSLYKIIHAASQFRIVNGWRRWDFQTPTKRDKNIEMVAYVRNALVESGVLKNPKIAFASDVSESQRNELSRIVDSLGGKFFLFFVFTSHLAWSFVSFSVHCKQLRIKKKTFQLGFL